MAVRSSKRSALCLGLPACQKKILVAFRSPLWLCVEVFLVAAVYAFLCRLIGSTITPMVSRVACRVTLSTSEPAVSFKLPCCCSFVTASVQPMTEVYKSQYVCTLLLSFDDASRRMCQPVLSLSELLLCRQRQMSSLLLPTCDPSVCLFSQISIALVSCRVVLLTRELTEEIRRRAPLALKSI